MKQEVREGDAAAELAGFAGWFAAAALPLDWRLEEMLMLLRMGVHPRPGFLVAEELPSAAEPKPLLSVRILHHMLEGEESWSTDAWREQIQAVLRTALSSEDEDACRVADETLNWLLAMGYRNFRAVIEADPAGELTRRTMAYVRIPVTPIDLVLVVSAPGPRVRVRVQAWLHRPPFAAVRCNADLRDLQDLSVRRDSPQLVLVDF